VTSENADDPDALRAMTRDQLVELGGERDEVHVVKTPRAPFAGTKDARWAERSVASWFALSMLFAVAFVACFVFWPDDYVVPGEPGYGWYAWNTPILGVTFGGTVLALGIGVIAYVKRFFPEETAVQRHSPGPSEPVERAPAGAPVAAGGADRPGPAGRARRGRPRRSRGRRAATGHVRPEPVAGRRRRGAVGDGVARSAGGDRLPAAGDE
jgi:hypothetical protein